MSRDDRPRPGGDDPCVASGSGAAPPAPDSVGGSVVIDVIYNGPDLTRVARLSGMTEDAVVAAHAGSSWWVEHFGFAPGFAYLTGGDPRLAVPRLDAPRPEVPSGAVGLAGQYSGIYPRASPGGWNLIGHTDAVLWDLDAVPPALLRVGMAVVFRAVREQVRAGADRATAVAAQMAHTVTDGCDPSPHRRRESSAPRPDTGTTITVLSPGTLCLIQDLGRGGLTDIGVSPSGAADLGAARRGNELVGNAPDAAVLELLFGGAALRADADLTMAVTGAGVPLRISGTGAQPDGDAAGTNVPIHLPRGTVVRIGRPSAGLRAYVAVRGGIDVPPVLGSRSTDTLSGIGPEPVRAGDVLPVGEPRAARPAPPAESAGSDHHECAAAHVPTAAGPRVLLATPGPQRHHLSHAQWQRFTSAGWTVSRHSNRVGLRLDGESIGVSAAAAGHMRYQPLQRGSVQLPPSGQPIIFLADHPVTGGYPVVAVLTEVSADAAAQCRPGQPVRIAEAPGERDPHGELRPLRGA